MYTPQAIYEHYIDNSAVYGRRGGMPTGILIHSRTVTVPVQDGVKKKWQDTIALLTQLAGVEPDADKREHWGYCLRTMVAVYKEKYPTFEEVVSAVARAFPDPAEEAVGEPQPEPEPQPAAGAATTAVALDEFEELDGEEG